MRCWVPAGLVLGLVGGGCKRGASSDVRSDVAEAVVRVDDKVVRVADVEAHLKRLPEPVRNRYATPSGRKELADNLVRFELLASEGIRRGIDKRPEIQRLVKQQIINVLMQEELNVNLQQADGGPAGVTDAAAEKYYRDNQALFQRGEQLRIAHILVRDRAAAARVARGVRRVKVGTDGFEKMVGQFSEDAATKERGGDVGWIGRDNTEYSPTLVAAAFSLAEVGATSDPVETEHGFHILRLTEKRAPGPAPFDEVKEEAKARLAQQQQDESSKRFIESLRSKARIQIFEDRLQKAVTNAAPP